MVWIFSIWEKISLGKEGYKISGQKFVPKTSNYINFHQENFVYSKKPAKLLLLAIAEVLRR